MQHEPPVMPQPESLAEQEADVTPQRLPLPVKVGASKPACENFLEGREDPRQSEELERQQDA